MDFARGSVGRYYCRFLPFFLNRSPKVNMFFDFLKILGITLSIAWTFLILLLYLFAQSIPLKEIFIGCLLPVLCFIPGFYAVSWAVDRPFRPFMIAVFGGMLIRLIFIGTVFILVVILTQLHVSSMLFSLVGFYTLCLVVELYFVNSKVRPREEVQE